MLESSLSKRKPEKVEKFGEKLGNLFFRLGKKRRVRARENLLLAMPELSEQQVNELVPRIFQHFGRTTADFLASKNRNLDKLMMSTEVVGRANLDNALAHGKGVLLVTGHLGNWERISSWLSLSGYPLSVIIRDADQEGVNQVVNSLRTWPGTNVIPRGNAARPIMEKLRQGEIVGILPDQNAEDAFLPFFGKPAGTNLGVGVFHERLDAKILPVYCVYIGSGRYKIVFEPSLTIDTPTAIKGESTLRAINLWLESVIRQYPEQWLWFHDRWRNAREAGLL